MTLSEKAAYLKGLKEGLKLDEEKAEGKLIAGMLDMLEAVAVSVRELQENAELVSDELDEIEEALDNLDDAVADIEDFLDGDYDEDDWDDEDDDYPYDDDVVFETKCPECEAVITITEDQLDAGSITCPTCGEVLEFDFDDEAEDEE